MSLYHPNHLTSAKWTLLFFSSGFETSYHHTRSLLTLSCWAVSWEVRTPTLYIYEYDSLDLHFVHSFIRFLDHLQLCIQAPHCYPNPNKYQMPTTSLYTSTYIVLQLRDHQSIQAYYMNIIHCVCYYYIAFYIIHNVSTNQPDVESELSSNVIVW